MNADIQFITSPIFLIHSGILVCDMALLTLRVDLLFPVAAL